MASHPSKLKLHHPWLFLPFLNQHPDLFPPPGPDCVSSQRPPHQESPQQRSDSKLWFTSQLPVSKLEKKWENARFWVKKSAILQHHPPKKRSVSNTIGKDACKRSRTCSTKLSSYRIDRYPTVVGHGWETNPGMSMSIIERRGDEGSKHQFLILHTVKVRFNLFRMRGGKYIHEISVNENLLPR